MLSYIVIYSVKDILYSQNVLIRLNVATFLSCNVNVVEYILSNKYLFLQEKSLNFLFFNKILTQVQKIKSIEFADWCFIQSFIRYPATNMPALKISIKNFSFVTLWLDSSGVVGCLAIWVYGISSFVGYLMPSPFLYKSSSISDNPV